MMTMTSWKPRYIELSRRSRKNPSTKHRGKMELNLNTSDVYLKYSWGELQVASTHVSAKADFLDVGRKLS